MRGLSFFALFLIVFSVSIASAQDTFNPVNHKGFSTEVNSNAYNELMDKFDVKYYKLDLHASNTSAYIEGTVTIKAKVVVESLDEIVVQLINNFEVDAVRCNGEAVEFSHENDEINIAPSQPIENEDYFTIEIDYAGFSTNNNRGLTNSVHSQWGVPVTWTLSESFHSKSWFPVKESLTDKADSADIFITVPQQLTAVSNGLLKDIVDLGNGFKRFEWVSRYPITYYLISITVADYQEYNIYCNPVGMDEPLLIQNFVYNVSGCLDFYKGGIDRTGGFIELYSELYGTYPFANEKYGHVMSPFGGGMEHQTISMMGGFSYNLVAHELAHMWFGDYVTCATWQDIWVNEGFASYSEFLAYEHQGQMAGALSWMDYAHERAKYEPYGSVYIPAQEATNESRIFSYNLSYKKGAAIIHSLRYELNDNELFFTILKEFLSRHGHSHATGLDFLNVVNELSGEDYGWFFDQWYYGIGYPHFQVNYARDGNTNFITISQYSSAGNSDFFKTSLELRTLEGENVINRRYSITESPQTFTYESELPITYLGVDPDNWILKKVDSVTEVPVNYANTKVSVGPNPFSDYIQITLSNIDLKTNISVFDVLGKLVHFGSYSDKSVQIPTSSLKNGIYILKIEHSQGTETLKVVKK